MSSPEKNKSKGFFSAMTSGLSMFGNAMHRSVNGYFFLNLCFGIALCIIRFVIVSSKCFGDDHDLTLLT